MKKYFLIIILVVTISSCKKSKTYEGDKNTDEISEKRYEGESFSFNYPNDWEITDSEEIETGIYYLSVEKDGFDSSGLITIILFSELIDLDELVMMNIEQLQNNPVVGNFNFEAIIDNRYNSIKSRSSNFKFSTLGMKHDGIVHGLNGNNSSCIILKQGVVEDTKKNIEGFTVIENSFKLE